MLGICCTTQYKAFIKFSRISCSDYLLKLTLSINSFEEVSLQKLCILPIAWLAKITEWIVSILLMKKWDTSHLSLSTAQLHTKITTHYPNCKRNWFLSPQTYSHFYKKWLARASDCTNLSWAWLLFHIIGKRQVCGLNSTKLLNQ